jgi:hypothetical protein
VDAYDNRESLADFNKSLAVGCLAGETLLAAASNHTLPKAPLSCSKDMRGAGRGYVPWHTLLINTSRSVVLLSIHRRTEQPPESNMLDALTSSWSTTAACLHCPWKPVQETLRT